MTDDQPRAPTAADLPTIDECRISHLRMVELERDVYRDKLKELGYTDKGLERWVTERLKAKAGTK